MLYRSLSHPLVALPSHEPKSRENNDFIRGWPEKHWKKGKCFPKHILCVFYRHSLVLTWAGDI